MKPAVMALCLLTAMLVDMHAAIGGGFYNAVAAYAACQEDALRGEHYAINGDCPAWEARKAGQSQGQQIRPHQGDAFQREVKGAGADEQRRSGRHHRR